MSETSASRANDTVLPPRLSGKQKVQSAATSTSAASQQLFGTGMTNSPVGVVPSGKVFITFYADTSEAYIILKTGASAATVTVNTGLPIGAGQQRDFWIDTTVDTYFEHIAAASGRIYWYVSSSEHDNVLGLT
jgi:hypothetical protein